MRDRKRHQQESRASEGTAATDPLAHDGWDDGGRAPTNTTVASGGTTSHGTTNHDMGNHDMGSHGTGNHDMGSHGTGNHDMGSHGTGNHRAASSGEATAREVGACEEVEAPAPQNKESAEDSKQPTVPLDQHQRLLAEFDNYRKRMERDIARAGFLARVDVLSALLPVLDDLNRARNALDSKKDVFDTEGMLIIIGRLAETLSREGLTEVEASPGQAFDPEIHEAVLTVPTAEFAEGCVAEVLEKGYQCGERLLRAAKVAVARSPEDARPEAKNGRG